jgi:hypothetical protein
MLGRSDYAKANAWIREHLPSFKRRTGGEERVMGGLFQARERARQRQTRGEAEKGKRLEGKASDEQVPNTTGKPSVSKTTQPPNSEPSSESQDKSTEETLSRLKDAKKRARRED